MCTSRVENFPFFFKFFWNISKIVNMNTEKDEVAFWKAELLRVSEKQSEDRMSCEESSMSVDTKYKLYSKNNAISIFRSIRTFLIERGGWSQSDRHQSANLIFTAHTNVGKKRGMKAGGMNFAVLRNRAMINCVRHHYHPPKCRFRQT